MELERFLAALGTFRDRGTGIERWSVYASERRGLNLGIKDRDAGSAHTPMSIADGCGARYLLVWSDGLVSRGSLERRQLVQEPEAALAQARTAAYDDPDAAQVLGPAPLPEVELHDADVAALAGGDTAVLAGRLASVRRRVEEHGLETWSGSFSAAEGAARLVTSAGLDVSGRGTSTGWSVSLEGKLGSGHGARRLEPDDEFESRLDRLVELTLALRQPAPPAPGDTRPVILHPGVVEQYVLGTLLHNLDGSAVANHESHFRVEEFGAGRPVLREDLGLRLDPLEPLKSGSYRFTTEGVPAARCAYIEGGKLVAPLLDLKYAKRLGREPTPLPFSLDTLHLEDAEPLDLPAALAQAGGGVLVLSVLGVHTQDATSGDFSLSAPHSLAITDGGFGGAVRCTISGNLFSVLRDARLRLVRFEGEHTPGLAFPCRVDPK